MVDSTSATIDGTMRADEVKRRLPEVELIEDEELREQTLDALQRMVPDYFWEVPATSSGRYHNPFARRRHGLWAHVKMVFTAYERIVDSYVELGIISELEADMGRAAVLLHDALKYGHEYEEGDSTVRNHDNLASHWLSHNSELPKTVVDAVARHNGGWYEGPSPVYEDEPVAMLVHTADMIGSTKNVTCGVYEPAEELISAYPQLPHAEL